MKVGIIRLSHLGDIIHALPLAYVIRNFSKEYEVNWIIEDKYLKIFNGLSFVDKFIKFSFKPGELFFSFKNLRDNIFDIIIDVQGLIKTQIIAFFSNSCKRIGFSFKDLKEKFLFFTYHKKIATKGEHIIEKNLSFADYLGIKEYDLKYYNLKEISRDENKNVSIFLEKYGIEKFGVFHPFSSSREKNFPLEPIKGVADYLDSKKVKIILTSGPGQEKKAEDMAKFLKAILAPFFNVNEMAYLIEKSLFFVGPDTGFYHISDALKKPKIGYFSWHPPERNGNFFSPALNFYKREIDFREILNFLEENCF